MQKHPPAQTCGHDQPQCQRCPSRSHPIWLKFKTQKRGNCNCAQPAEKLSDMYLLLWCTQLRLALQQSPIGIEKGQRDRNRGVKPRTDSFTRRIQVHKENSSKCRNQCNVSLG